MTCGVCTGQGRVKLGSCWGARGSARARPAAGGWPWRLLSGPGRFWMPGGQPVAGIGTQAVELVNRNVVWSAVEVVCVG